MTQENPYIAITMGDPAGVGPEIILKLFSANNQIYSNNIFVIGDFKHLQRVAKKISVNIPIEQVELSKLSSLGSDTLKVLDLDNVPPDLEFGKVSREGGKASAEYIIKGVELASLGLIGVITTCPINKEALNMGGYHYAGHTEMLADLTNTTDYAMLLQGGGIRVVLVTTHMAISDVPKAISREAISRVIKLTDRVLGDWLAHRPRMAVTALNPHGGEGGLFGAEEKNIISPAIEETFAEGIDVSGPYPADSLFAENNRNKYDVVVVMYHDQGLIPIKMAAFGRAVNVTIGLPFIRTSVDHGTAYDIAGKGVVNSSSLCESLKSASALLNVSSE